MSPRSNCIPSTTSSSVTTLRSLGTQRDPHSVGEDVDAAQHAVTRSAGKCDLLGYHGYSPIQDSIGVASRAATIHTPPSGRTVTQRDRLFQLAWLVISVQQISTLPDFCRSRVE